MMLASDSARPERGRICRRNLRVYRQGLVTQSIDDVLGVQVKVVGLRLCRHDVVQPLLDDEYNLSQGRHKRVPRPRGRNACSLGGKLL